MPRIICLILGLSLTGCSLEVSLEQLTEFVPPSILPQERKEPDFIHGEVITTHAGTAGYQLRGVFGEVSEKTASLNGNHWQVEGVFYE